MSQSLAEARELDHLKKRVVKLEKDQLQTQLNVMSLIGLVEKIVKALEDFGK